MAVANRDIQPLDRLNRGMFRLMPATSQTPKEAVASLEQFDGQIATNFIAKDEPVTAADVDFPDPKYGMPFQIPPGYRGMAVPVNPVSGIAGFLKPGNRVDVVGTFARGDEAFTRTVVEDVVLLAYGQSLREEPKASDPASSKEAESEEKPAEVLPDTATLLVSPAQAETLALAAAKAKLNLSLRGMKETAPIAFTPGDKESRYWHLESEPPLGARLARAVPPAAAGPRPSPVPAAPAVAAHPRPPADAEPGYRPVIVIRGTRQEVVQVPR
jgi:pilus assembly protein CpaB